MYVEHKLIQKPSNPNVKIWRYLDFTKYVSLLDTQALFFVLPEMLVDPFEGAYTKPMVISFLQEIREYFPEDEFFSKVKDSLLGTVGKTMCAVNCWHTNDHESAAMWKLYLKSNEGIAIQSTFERLISSFHRAERNIMVGEVVYLDYDKEWFKPHNVLVQLFHKRRSFEHEKEIRAITMSPQFIGHHEEPLHGEKFTNTGLYVPIDLNILVEAVYVSPTCQEWFVDLVKSVTEKYGFDKNLVTSSTLFNPPNYES